MLRRQRRASSAMVVIVALASAAALAGAPPSLPGPAAPGQRPHRLAGGAPSGAAACASCHAEIAVEWRASAHGGAWRDPLFQKAYALEHLAWCRTCHAPEGDPAAEPTPAAQEEAIGCATCHVAGGRIVSASASAAHGGVADARWATASACAGCHQFLFPDVSAQVVPSAMQDTVREWAASSFAAVACGDCHLPRVRGEGGREHRSHRFQVRDAATLARAVRVTAERGEDAVTLTLRSDRVGHAVPTGDLFRRLVVRAFVVPDAYHEAPLGRPAILARSFLDVPVRRDHPGDAALQRVEAGDTRLAPPGLPDAERSVRFPLPPAQRGARVRWEVAYQRMSDAVAASFGVAQAADEIVFAHGAIEARGSVGGP